jgi:hypothetical protein
MAAIARIASAPVTVSDRIDVPVSLRKACSSDSDANEYFRKPLDVEKFLDAVRKYVQPSAGSHA